MSNVTEYDVPVSRLLSWRVPDRDLHRLLALSPDLTVLALHKRTRIAKDAIESALSRLSREGLAHPRRKKFATGRPRLVWAVGRRGVALHARRSRSARRMWPRRKQVHGPAGTRRLIGKPVAAIAARIARTRRTCGDGHRWTAANTRWGKVDPRTGTRRRYCRACDAIWVGRAQLAQVAARRADTVSLSMLIQDAREA